MIYAKTYTRQEFAHLRQTEPENADNLYHWRNTFSKDPCESYLGAKWYAGIKTIQQAQDLFDNGWPEGSAKLQSLLDHIGELEHARSRRRVPAWSDQGDDLSVDRALTGDWERAWRSSRRVWSAGSSTVDLIIAFGGNAHRGSDELFWSGAAGLVVADVLESAGYRVAVTAVWPLSNGGTDRFAPQVTLKTEDEPIQIDTFASLLCHAGVQRTLGFRMLGDAPFNLGLGLGRSERIDDVRSALPENAVAIPAAYSLDAVLQTVRNTINAVQGV